VRPPASRVVLSVAAGVLVLPAVCEAQSWRAQGIWVAEEVLGVVAGGEVRRPLGRAPELPLPGRREGAGPVEAPSRSWLLTGMLAAGLNTRDREGDGGPSPAGNRDRDRRSGPLFYAHGGLVYRTGWPVLDAMGVVGMIQAPRGLWGPTVVFDVARVGYVQVGALRGNGSWRRHLSLGVSLSFVADVLEDR